MNNHAMPRVPFRRVSLLTAAAGLALTLAGCAVGPDYTAKPAKTSESFAAAGQTQQPDAKPVESTPVPEAIAPGDLARWWGAFGDPLLNSLIERAVVNNHALRVDPLFVGMADDLFTLGAGSPCIDAGDNGATSISAVDSCLLTSSSRVL